MMNGCCPYCLRYEGHDSMCPLYEMPEGKHTCTVCGEDIYPGEEYIVNPENDYVHWECVECKKSLVEFLGYKVEIMED